jgi:hypothetical protein
MKTRVKKLPEYKGELTEDQKQYLRRLSISNNNTKYVSQEHKLFTPRNSFVSVNLNDEEEIARCKCVIL